MYQLHIEFKLCKSYICHVSVLCTHKSHTKTKIRRELKLQAAMEGTSHPAPPSGGFRKTGNNEQYAFKKVNIEERVKVIYMCQTCCQLVALCP